VFTDRIFKGAVWLSPTKNIEFYISFETLELSKNKPTYLGSLQAVYVFFNSSKISFEASNLESAQCLKLCKTKEVVEYIEDKE
jgi:hypothetical protein